MSPFHRTSPLSLTLRPIALALTLLTGATAFAQTASPTTAPTPSAPSSPTLPNSTNTGDGTTASQLPSSPHTATKKHTNATKTIAAPTPAAGGFLDQRINLSDTHRLWHPSRKQLGLAKNGDG